jgi:hypothetical protein
MIGAMTGAVESASTNSETALIVLVAERSQADLREQSEPRKWLNIHLPSELQNFRSRTPLPDRIHHRIHRGRPKTRRILPFAKREPAAAHATRSMRTQSMKSSSIHASTFTRAEAADASRKSDAAFCGAKEPRGEAIQTLN